ncbi:MAG: site-2 protease family protein [Verrucomicrobiota bacterium]
MALVSGRLNASSGEEIFLLGLFIIAGFISILIHELGHALTARAFGAHAEITLEAFGGYAAYGGVSMSRPKSFLITLAGPAVQIALGVIAWFAIPFAREQEAAASGITFLKDLVWVSWIWAILNLLPVLPLDGGRLMQTILGPRNTRTTLILSMVFAIAAAIAGVIFTGSIFLPVFMGYFAWQAYSALKQIR